MNRRSTVGEIMEVLAATGIARVSGFGIFSVVEVPERKGVNPGTGEPLVCAPHRRVSFRPYKTLKGSLIARGR